MAVHGGLHHHAALDAEVRVQRVELVLRCVAGGEAALGGEGEQRLRPEDVEVRIAGAARQREPRLARRRMEAQLIQLLPKASKQPSLKVVEKQLRLLW